MSEYVHWQSHDATIATINIDFPPIARRTRSHSYFFFLTRFSLLSFVLFFFHLQKNNVEFFGAASHSSFRNFASVSLTLVSTSEKTNSPICSANKITQCDQSPLISIPGTPILFAWKLNYKHPSLSQQFAFAHRWVKSFVDTTKSLCQSRIYFLVSLPLLSQLNKQNKKKRYKKILPNFMAADCVFLFFTTNLNTKADDSLAQQISRTLCVYSSLFLFLASRPLLLCLYFFLLTFIKSKK